MSTPATDPRTKRAIAVFASITLAAVVFAVASRMQDQGADVADRQWYGEQWDVARYCLVGTPIGRRDGPTGIATQLEARAYATLAELEREPDPDARWPVRCLSQLAQLRDPPELSADPEPILAELEIAIARAMTAPRTVASVPERVRALAEPIAQLDGLMPSGAEYDPARYPLVDPGVGREAIVRSHACPPVSPPRRVFLAATIGGEPLHDERTRGDVSERLVGPPGGLRLVRSGPDGTEERALRPGGLRLPRFFDETRLAWLSAEDEVPAVVLESIEDGTRAEPLVVAGHPPRGWAVRDGVIVLRGERSASLVRWTGPDPALSIDPRPPDEGLVWASDDATVALAWFEEGHWIGARCADTCRSLPALAAGGDLQLAVVDGALFALARGAESDLALGWRLAPESAAWSGPVPLARGRLERTEDGLLVRDCGGSVPFPDVSEPEG